MSNDRIQIRPNTIEEELNRIQETVRKLPWFKEHGYTPKLPKKLESLQEEYKPEIYAIGVNILKKNREQIEVVFPIFSKLATAWAFKVFPHYEIVVTRYGMGGSYSSETGKIIMRVEDSGKFLRLQPYHTPIHEMIHIGIEEVIVKKYKLTQEEKERSVDLMAVTLFKDIMPDYKLQSIGDSRIDRFITAETIPNLPAAINRYVNEYPRSRSS
ncbi:MAG: hypothetical protein NT141_00015 [candidate division WWE3 bacterium]|nr:hypothetical protein [candidate division WWE3 bacterium]